MNNKIAVIGGGPAGCAFSCFSQNNDITVFESGNILQTLLYTGGGRCNLAYAEFDIKELTKNYPRGEKFLYSVFSQFSTQETLNFFKNIGVNTYTQNDYRIFPKSDSAKEVRNAILNQLHKKKTKIIKEKVFKIIKKNNNFIINDKFLFDKVVIATGGHAGYKMIESLGHTIVEPKPSLVGLITKENFNLEGVSLQNTEIFIKSKNKKLTGDLVFTKKGISGPLAYIISSLFARENYSKDAPIELFLNFKIENIIDILNNNGKKDVKNVISQYMPKSIANYIAEQTNLENKKCFEITKDMRKILEKYLTAFPITIIGHESRGEVVTAGGVNLKEINSKTMESKIVEGVYFCGEVIDVDGFCGGFNLQNAWSTAFVAANALNSLN